MRGFDLFFIPKPFGNSTSWQDDRGSEFKISSPSYWFLPKRVLLNPSSIVHVSSEYQYNIQSQNTAFSASKYSDHHIYFLDISKIK